MSEEKIKEVKNYYFTFGSAHKHPKNGTDMQDYYVKVITTSFEEARRLLMEKYSNKFAFQYTDESMNFKFCSMGCYETIVERSIKI